MHPKYKKYDDYGEDHVKNVSHIDLLRGMASAWASIYNFCSTNELLGKGDHGHVCALEEVLQILDGKKQKKSKQQVKKSKKIENVKF